MPGGGISRLQYRALAKLNSSLTSCSQTNMKKVLKTPCVLFTTSSLSSNSLNASISSASPKKSNAQSVTHCLVCSDICPSVLARKLQRAPERVPRLWSTLRSLISWAHRLWFGFRRNTVCASIPLRLRPLEAQCPKCGGKYNAEPLLSILTVGSV